jgi:hypothetical protein
VEKRGGSGWSRSRKKVKRGKSGRRGGEVEELCGILRRGCRISEESARSPRKKKLKTSPGPAKEPQPKERFTFEIMVFKNFETPFPLPPPTFLSRQRPDPATPLAVDPASFQFRGIPTFPQTSKPSPPVRSLYKVPTYIPFPVLVEMRDAANKFTVIVYDWGQSKIV